MLQIIGILVAVISAGCASPGDPVPRQRAVVPVPVRDLEARQQGNEIVLTFTLPSRNTRNQPLIAPPAIEIYRAEALAAGPSKVSPALIYTIPVEMVSAYQEEGRITFRDPVPSDEFARSGGWLVYEVRTREARNHASAPSNRVQVMARIPPPSVQGLQAAVAGGAVTLKWTAAGQDAEYNVYRAELAPAGATGAQPEPSKPDLIAPLRLLARLGTANYIDRTVELGHRYMYIVRQAVTDSIGEIESADSRPAVITAAQNIPPGPPQGLAAIVVPAGGGLMPYIALSWDIAGGQGISGYAVYRSEGAEVLGNRLNPELLATPTYTDTSAIPGRHYFYRVTVFNQANQESEPSLPIEASIPPNP